MLNRLRRWWGSRPCYTEIFPFDSVWQGVTVTCEEAEAYYDRLRHEAIERHRNAVENVTRPEMV